MEKIIKKAGILSVVLLIVGLIVLIICVNVRYHTYFNITDVNMDEQYITEWGSVNINNARILSKDEFTSEYQGVKSYIYDEGDNDKGYVVICVTFDVSDVEKYDPEWFKMWTIEADKVWSNGKDMMVNSYMNENNKITENKKYEMYCVFGFVPKNIRLKEFDEVYNLNYKILINHNPIIYYKLDITR